MGFPAGFAGPPHAAPACRPSSLMVAGAGILGHIAPRSDQDTARPMKSFICEQNIANFERLLAETIDPALQRTLEGLLASNRRELALIEAEQRGAQDSPFGKARRKPLDAAA